MTRSTSARFAVCGVGDSVSVTVTVKLLAPTVVGVPLITPVVGERLRPAGRAPVVTAYLYGAMPPAAVSVSVYATLTIAFGAVPVSVRVGTGSTVMVMGPVVVMVGLLESVTFTVTGVDPGVVGVPVMVQPVSVRPAGSVPETRTQVYGPVPPVMPMGPE